MIDKNFELKVGIFIVIGIVIFFFIVFSIGDIAFTVKPGYTIKLSFNHIDGVAGSAPVRYAGVDVGHVTDINIYFDDKEGRNKVKVTVWINDINRLIEKDAVATINTLGLLGEKYIEIFPGNPSNGIAEPGEFLNGKNPFTMSDITDSLMDLTESAKVIIKRLEKGEGTVGKFLVDEKIYNDLEEFVADIKSHPWKLLHKPR